jgi:1-acyl-sn-glycerol-3-phosphate acyltransferase
MVVLILKGILVVFLSAAGGLAAILLRLVDPKRKHFHWIPRTYSKLVLRLFGIAVNVKGGENVQAGQPYVFVSNHASLFDIPAVVHGIPVRIHIVYKKELEHIPFFGWGLKFGSNYIAIDRGRGPEAAESLDRAVEKIRGGKSVLLFAEGTRTKDGKLQPFKRGAFNLAVRAGVPVVPVTINGSYNILPKGTFKVNPGAITLILDKPIEIQKNGKEEELKLMEAVHKVIEKHYIEQ